MPGYFDDIRNFLVNNPMFPIDPIGSTLRNYIQDKDVESQAKFEQGFRAHYPDAGEFKQAMIPRKENIAAFLNKVMQSKVPAEIVKKYPRLGTALALAEARVPNLVNAAKSFGNIKVGDRGFVREAGSFDPKTSDVRIYANPETQSNVADNVKNYLNIAIHELAHSDQYNRASSKFAKNELLVPNSPLLKQGETGLYTTPEASEKAVGDLSLYMKQRVEEDARNRGDLGGNVVDKVISLLPDIKQHEAFGNRATNVQHDMQKLASYFNRAIKLAHTSTDDPVLNAERVKDLTDFRNSGLERMKSNAARAVRRNPDKPYENAFDINTNPFQTNFIPLKIANQVAPELINPADLKMNSLIRQVQEAKGVGPMQEWLKKTLNIESLAKRDANDAAVRAQKALDFQQRRDKYLKTWEDAKNEKFWKLFPEGFK
jgi:hypothetical protein